VITTYKRALHLHIYIGLYGISQNITENSSKVIWRFCPLNWNVRTVYLFSHGAYSVTVKVYGMKGHYSIYDLYSSFYWAVLHNRVRFCKILGFRGGDYEEYRLLGYKNPLRTSQETHYVSTTEPSRLMLCRIWGFYGGDYEECRLLRCYAEWLL
jgi:hypothetical protein